MKPCPSNEVYFFLFLYFHQRVFHGMLSKPKSFQPSQDNELPKQRLFVESRLYSYNAFSVQSSACWQAWFYVGFQDRHCSCFCFCFCCKIDKIMYNLKIATVNSIVEAQTVMLTIGLLLFHHQTHSLRFLIQSGENRTRLLRLTISMPSAYASSSTALIIFILSNFDWAFCFYSESVFLAK